MGFSQVFSPQTAGRTRETHIIVLIFPVVGNYGTPLVLLLCLQVAFDIDDSRLYQSYNQLSPWGWTPGSPESS